MNEIKLKKIYRILLVEDDADMPLFILAALGRHNFFIRHAADGRFALKCLKEEIFDLMLCDIMMPYIGGFKLLEVAKEQLIQLPPIIMLSALHDKESVLKARDLGAAGYLAKPVTYAQLLDKVKEVLQLNNEAIIDKTQMPLQIGTSTTNTELTLYLSGCPTKDPAHEVKQTIARAMQTMARPKEVKIHVSSEFAYEARAIPYLEELARLLQKQFNLARHGMRFAGGFFSTLTLVEKSAFEQEHIVLGD